MLKLSAFIVIKNRLYHRTLCISFEHSMQYDIRFEAPQCLTPTTTWLSGLVHVTGGEAIKPWRVDGAVDGHDLLASGISPVPVQVPVGSRIMSGLDAGFSFTDLERAVHTAQVESKSSKVPSSSSNSGVATESHSSIAAALRERDLLRERERLKQVRQTEEKNREWKQSNMLATKDSVERSQHNPSAHMSPVTIVSSSRTVPQLSTAVKMSSLSLSVEKQQRHQQEEEQLLRSNNGSNTAQLRDLHSKVVAFMEDTPIREDDLMLGEDHYRSRLLGGGNINNGASNNGHNQRMEYSNEMVGGHGLNGSTAAADAGRRVSGLGSRESDQQFLNAAPNLTIVSRVPIYTSSSSYGQDQGLGFGVGNRPKQGRYGEDPQQR